MLDMSQEKLAEDLGLTFQQVQKYEKKSEIAAAFKLGVAGTNRISASRLMQMSHSHPSSPCCAKVGNINALRPWPIF
jgi:hypothetical protein